MSYLMTRQYSSDLLNSMSCAACIARTVQQNHMLDEYKVFAHLSFDVTCSACYAQLPAYLAALVEVTGDCVAPTLPTLASRSNGLARTAYKDFVTYQAIRTFTTQLDAVQKAYLAKTAARFPAKVSCTRRLDDYLALTRLFRSVSAAT